MDVYCFECPDHRVAVRLFTSMITVTLYISNVVIVFMILLCVIHCTATKTKHRMLSQDKI